MNLKVFKNKDFCRILMSSQFKQDMKLDKISYIIYDYLESLIRKIDGCANNPQNSLTPKIDELIPHGYSISTMWAFNRIENKHSLNRGENA